VRCPCRTSRAIVSQTVATIARQDTHSLIESRSTTCVEASAGRSPSASATATSTDGSISEYVPTAPEMATTPTRSRAARSRSRERAIAKARSATR
jgi:hypothetical protein